MRCAWENCKKSATQEAVVQLKSGRTLLSRPRCDEHMRVWLGATQFVVIEMRPVVVEVAS